MSVIIVAGEGRISLVKNLKRIALLTIVMLAVYAVEAYAVMYKYVDENGTLFLTSDLQSIPIKYRNSVEVVEEDHSTDGFSPEGELADEIRQKRKDGGSRGQIERSNARWYKENPDIEPSVPKRLKHYAIRWWKKIPFERIWPAGAAVLWVVISWFGSLIIDSVSQRRLFRFFSILTALTFLMVMYSMVLK